MLKFLRIPFGQSGDRAAVPDAPTGGGDANFTEGYGADYARPKTDPLSKNIEREKMNQLFFDLSNATRELQAQGVPDFITPVLNGGSPFPYAKNAVVRWTDGNVYTSLVSANTSEPSDPTKWAPGSFGALADPAQGDALVAVEQPFTGAVPRTQHGKNADEVSVTDYGAVEGDSPAYEAINDAAIAAAIADMKSSRRKCLVFPTGLFRTSTTITLGGSFEFGVELRGSQTTIRCSGNVPVVDVNCRVPDSPPQVRMNVKISGFVLHGSGQSNPGTVGLKAQRGAGVKISDVTCRDAARGLYGFGNLISHYEDIVIFNTGVALDFAPDGIEFAPNDIHFVRVKAFDNFQALRAVNFPNGAMTFIGCELEGNNLSGNVADGVRVIEFSNAGKVTMLGCHTERNPGQFNIYFSGNSGAHLSMVGGENIPGDDCANVLYMANAHGAATLTMMGSRATNNDTGLGQRQVVLETGTRAQIDGTFAGGVFGDLTNLVWIREGHISLGASNFLAGGNGIVFPSVQNPSADPNSLDDYAEGDFFPVIAGGTTPGTATYTAQRGRFTKIGRLVFVEIYLTWSAGTGVGDLKIAGLPFVSSAFGALPSATIGRSDALVYSAGHTPCANVASGTSEIGLFQVPSGGGVPFPIPYRSAGTLLVSANYTV